MNFSKRTKLLDRLDEFLGRSLDGSSPEISERKPLTLRFGSADDIVEIAVPLIFSPSRSETFWRPAGHFSLQEIVGPDDAAPHVRNRRAVEPESFLRVLEIAPSLLVI